LPGAGAVSSFEDIVILPMAAVCPSADARCHRCCRLTPTAASLGVGVAAGAHSSLLRASV
jgi:hypothetical protein